MMKGVIHAVGITLLIGAAAMAQAPSPATTAITNVTVVDVRSGAKRPAVTVFITGDRITAITPSANARIPQDTRVLDAAGKYLIPGLIDSHVHLGMQWIRQPADTLAQLGWIVAGGVTTVRNMFAFGFERNLVGMRAARDSGRIIGPRIYIAEPLTPQLMARLGVRDMGEAIRRFPVEGLDAVKILNHTPDTALQIIRAARGVQLPVIGHTLARDSLGMNRNVTLAALSLGISGVSHMPAALFPFGPAGDPRPTPSFPREAPQNRRAWTVYNQTAWQTITDGDYQALIAAFVKQNAWFEPTLALTAFNTGRLQFDSAALARRYTWERNGATAADSAVRRAQQGNWEAGARFVRRFVEAGGTLLAGTDHVPFPPFGVTEEMRVLVEIGISPLVALQAATINPARAMAWDHRLGTIEVGKLADVLVLDADPLVDITNVRRIRAVIIGGRVIDRADLDALLAREGTPISSGPPRP